METKPTTNNGTTVLYYYQQHFKQSYEVLGRQKPDLTVNNV